MNSQADIEPVSLRLSGDEALVLFDLLSRWTEAGAPTPDDACFETAAEPAALHSLLSELEAKLTAPLDPGYQDILEAARERLSAGWVGKSLRD